MKKILVVWVILILVSLFFFSLRDTDKTKEEDTAVSVTYKALNYDNMKAMWLSQYDMESVYAENGKQRDEKDFVLKTEKIMDNMVSIGINTLIVQVRPFADSMYPSALYPMSYFVVGTYGRDAEYDPFAIILEKAHEKGISVHAWINPLRGMTEEEIKKVPESFKIREWYDNGEILKCVSGRMYLDPAYYEARDLIVQGATEIVRLYEVDGVHMDDYFYPTTDKSFDRESYEAYRSRGGTLDLADFRRENINSLVREIYSAVKSERDDVMFGISPAGEMNNNYYELYADVYEWCGNKGYVDYICPQIYFGFEHETCGFKKLCNQFSDMVKVDGIRLIIGMYVGKAVFCFDRYAGSGQYEWRDNKDILLRELEYTETLTKCSGVALFCYQYFFDPLTGEPSTSAEEEVNALLPKLRTANWK